MPLGQIGLGAKLDPVIARQAGLLLGVPVWPPGLAAMTEASHRPAATLQRPWHLMNGSDGPSPPPPSGPPPENAARLVRCMSASLEAVLQAAAPFAVIWPRPIRLRAGIAEGGALGRQARAILAPRHSFIGSIARKPVAVGDMHPGACLRAPSLAMLSSRPKVATHRECSASA
jgi:hypothetical protein